ncbi:iron-containing redox enzyme family protein [Methylomicrobium sp. RS1]|uniref:iron-containing redox enzyme family protein n=1 Tax=Candidatus Methylomicrobium oryzae TaxID=2802053 RepID=UPI001921BA39|nr:iron-containing redox enzyme family protein [Methylomicrobium sp. RS1]MBL1263747.1 iron-containing redox enzyme family protein [Methylomicrobium sp. RS1]
MHEPADPFALRLKPTFSKAVYRTARQYRQKGRALFHALIQDGEEPALYPFAYHFVESRLAGKASSDSTVLPSGWDCEDILQALTLQESTFPPITATRAQLRNALVQVQPVLLTEPCWLQNILQTATNHAPAAIALSAVYASSGAMAAPNKAFQALLLNAGLEIPDPGSSAFARNETIDSRFFDFAALQLALGQFPRVFFPEILGFTVAWCDSRSLLEGFSSDDHPEQASYLRLRQVRLSSAKPMVIETIRDNLMRLDDNRKKALWQRIKAGFDLYRENVDRCRQKLRNRLENPETAAQAAVKLFKEKAPAACGHHRHVRLEGRSLDDWFAEQPFDAKGFLAALHRSAYVDRQKPAASPLLKLFEFEGPMFGVLTEADRDCLKRWLSGGNAGLEEAPCPDETPPETGWLPAEGGDDTPAFGKMNRRELYHYLVNAELYPDVLPAAHRLVERVLRASGRFSRLPFTNYTHQAFTNHIDTLYRREIQAYEPLKRKPRLSRQAYVWGIEQLAPAILADGCWLQHASRLEFTAYAAVGASLSKIYDDETGNGIEAQNHPAIYRRLLDSLHIDLPPIHDPAFCHHPGFIDSAFDIPAYLLAISQFPASFLPELLGLNLAIELSGLGKVYLRLAEELEFWGIDPKIVKVHISIDNPASGHAALAGNAVQHYLDRIAAGQGSAAQNAHWRRTYRGYCSLAAAGRTFKIALAVRYLCRQFQSRCTGQYPFVRHSDQHG